MKRLWLVVVMLGSLWMTAAFADAMSDADAAVTDILWNYEGAAENAVYAVDARGNLDITFPRDVPDDVYIEIIDELKAHPDIKGVLAGKSGPACGAWY